MRVTTDNDKCVGAGQCAMLVPDVFDQGDDGIVVLLQKEPPEDVQDHVRQAALLCPSGSIRITD